MASHSAAGDGDRRGTRARSSGIRCTARTASLAVLLLVTGAGLAGCAALDTLAGVPPTAPSATSDGLEPVAEAYPRGGRVGWGFSPEPTATGEAPASRAPMRVAPPAPPQPLAPLRPGMPWPRPTGWSLEPYRDCPRLHDGTGVPLRVTAGPGTLTVRFQSRAQRELIGYRVGALAADGAADATAPRLVWRAAPAPKTCREVTVTVTGLARGTSYAILLVGRMRSGVDQRVRDRQLAQSEFVTTT